MVKYQFAVCAKDMLEPLPNLQAILRYGSESWGHTEVLNDEPTRDPVWKSLILPDKELILDHENTVLTVDIVQVITQHGNDDNIEPQTTNTKTTTSAILASARFEGTALSQAYYHALARYTNEKGDDKAKICLFFQPSNLGTLHLQLAVAQPSQKKATNRRGFLSSWLRKRSSALHYVCQIHSAVTGDITCRMQAKVKDDDGDHDGDHDGAAINITSWNPVEMDLDVLTGGNFDRPVEVRVLQLPENGDTQQQQYVGTVVMTVNDMLGTAKDVNQECAKNDSNKPKDFPLLKGGQPTQTCVLVQMARLTEQKYTSRQIQNKCQVVLTSLDSVYETLAAQAAAAKEQVQALEAPYEQQKSLIDEYEVHANTAAWNQHEAQSHWQDCQDTLQQYQAKAEKTPVEGQLHLRLRGQKLPDLDFGLFNKSDPMYEIVLDNNVNNNGGNNNNNNENDDRVVLRSDIVENSLSPTWKVHTLSLAKIGHMDTKLSIRLWDVNRKNLKDRHFMGCVNDLTIDKLVKMAPGTVLPLVKGPSKKAAVIVEQVVLEDLVDHVVRLEEYKTQKYQPALEEYEKATKAFEDAQKELDLARSNAAQAKKKLLEAQDKADNAQKALEIVQHGRH